MTGEFNGSPSRHFASRASSARSSSYASSAATPRSSKDALARCKGYAALSTDSQFPIPLPSPSYYSIGSTPPPNTPMYAIPGISWYNGQPKQAGEPCEPFPAFYIGPSNLNNVSPRPMDYDYRPQYPNLPKPGDFKFSNGGVVDLEKQRARDDDIDRDFMNADRPHQKRHCKRKEIFCLILTAIFIALIPIILFAVVLRNHRKLH